MSVTDPIRIGKLTLTPKEFVGTNVAITLEADGPEVGDGEVALRVVTDARDLNTMPPPEGPLVSTPLLPIPVWESLQQAAAFLNQEPTR